MGSTYTLVLGILIGILLGGMVNRSRGFLLRIIRSFGRRVRNLPRKTVGVSKKAATGSLGLGSGNAILRELLDIDERHVRENENFEEFSSNLIKGQFWFKQFVTPPGSILALDDKSDKDSEFISEFFLAKVQIETEADNLFDEEEGVVSARLLKHSDRPMLYAIDRFRAMVGRNALMMIFASILLLSVPAALGVVVAFLGVPDFFQSNISFSVLSGVFFVVINGAAFALLTTSYGKARGVSFGAFSSYLQNYFATASDSFLSAHSRMSNAIAGETDEALLEENAINSHRSMLWYAFRIFLVEGFLRNEHYQMRRNVRFYQLLYWILLFVVSALSVWGISNFTSFSIDFADWTLFVPWGFLGITGIAGLVIGFAYIGRPDTENAISNLDWRGFKELKIDEYMKQVIGSYAREAAIGKNRFGRTSRGAT